MAATISTHFSFTPHRLRQTVLSNSRSKAIRFPSTRTRRRMLVNPKFDAGSSLVARVCGDGGGSSDAFAHQSTSSNIEGKDGDNSSFGDGYVALFVRMLGLDQDPLDREQAVVALWKYSLGGKKQIDAIMQFHGCINLIVNLLTSDSTSTCEAAAGLLRLIASVNIYRDSVAGAGAMEEIIGLLSRPSLTPEVKEQCLCTLWNLSVDENFRVKIANSEVLPLIIKSLDDEDIKVKEAAGGVLSMLALSESSHEIMVEYGVIPKLAEALLKTDAEGSKVIRKEVKNALLEFAKNDYYRILIIEEGLVPVPMVGAHAYKSFRPSLHSWPSLPDGTEIEKTSKGPSRFGASELLLGLNVNGENLNVEEARINAIVGRTQQQFLARIGAIELEEETKSQPGNSSGWRLTLLPCMDGVARLILILELEDESAIARAAESIADASINEYMRISFKEAGAIKHLVKLLERDNDAIKIASTHALERLSLSNGVCHIIEAEGALRPLINTLKQKEISDTLLDKTLDLLARILDPTKEMRSKFYDGPINGSKGSSESVSRSDAANGFSGMSSHDSTSTTNSGVQMLDSAVISRLFEILKTSSLTLQRKAASILEFAAITSSVDTVDAANIESGLVAVFQQNVLKDTESDVKEEQPEQYALEVEEAGLAISAASRLLTKLLDSDCFRKRVDSAHFTVLLRKVLKSSIPVHCKDWVAACLVKLSSLSGFSKYFENPINVEVTLYETIPRLIEELKASFSPEAQEVAAVELNRIISEGVVDSTRAVASGGGIFLLVSLLEEGTARASEAALSILYNLSMDSENHPAIIAAGAVPALRRIVLAQRPQWTRALRLLRILPV
ncbi:uncharacterized protein LOC115727034 isoform X2 [Rhodamnia argentea]|uniref:Uncharacterized protein LOC115727034 isoform X2 n=1 Tax=Rhodamnia argentea TaxID=178133 RepID=A0A8B8MSG7_9MYRT|nr:uncharacterized protein LOC115727034 isoform X2 [Rhodamnia argentea]